VLKEYRQSRKGIAFRESDLATADEIYFQIRKLVKTSTRPDGESLESFWEAWGGRMEELTGIMEGGVLTIELDDLLRKDEKTDEHVETKVNDSELEIDVLNSE
jgi:hypothetical protein